jgi:hypothetical protein
MRLDDSTLDRRSYFMRASLPVALQHYRESHGTSRGFVHAGAISAQPAYRFGVSKPAT